MNPTARRLARKYALQALYQWQVSQTDPREIEAQFPIHQQMNKKTDFAYFKELLLTVAKLQPELDQQMLPFIKRPFAEVDAIELAILRLSIYELAHRLDIPYRVVINEALELTKQFGSIEGYKFVNGVLDQVAKELRQTEIQADKRRA